MSLSEASTASSDKGLAGHVFSPSKIPRSAKGPHDVLNSRGRFVTSHVVEAVVEDVTPCAKETSPSPFPKAPRKPKASHRTGSFRETGSQRSPRRATQQPPSLQRSSARLPQRSVEPPSSPKRSSPRLPQRSPPRLPQRSAAPPPPHERVIRRRSSTLDTETLPCETEGVCEWSTKADSLDGDRAGSAWWETSVLSSKCPRSPRSPRSPSQKFPAPLQQEPDKNVTSHAFFRASRWKYDSQSCARDPPHVGPGTYDISSRLGRDAPLYSQAPRFRGERPNGVPGPGHYNDCIPSSPRRAPRLNTTAPQRPSQSPSSRSAANAPMPGPGAYDCPSTLSVGPKYAGGLMNQHGSRGVHSTGRLVNSHWLA